MNSSEFMSKVISFALVLSLMAPGIQSYSMLAYAEGDEGSKVCPECEAKKMQNTKLAGETTDELEAIASKVTKEDNSCTSRLSPEAIRSLDCLNKIYDDFKLTATPPDALDKRALACIGEMATSQFKARGQKLPLETLKQAGYAVAMQRFFKNAEDDVAIIRAKMAMNAPLTDQENHLVNKLNQYIHKYAPKADYRQILKKEAAAQRPLIKDAVKNYGLKLGKQGMDFSSFPFNKVMDTNSKESRLIGTLYGPQKLHEIRQIYTKDPKQQVLQAFYVGNMVVIPNAMNSAAGTAEGKSDIAKKMVPHPVAMKGDEYVKLVKASLKQLQTTTRNYLKAANEVGSWRHSMKRVGVGAVQVFVDPIKSKLGHASKQPGVTAQDRELQRRQKELVHQLDILEATYGLNTQAMHDVIKKELDAVEAGGTSLQEGLNHIDTMISATYGTMGALAVVLTGGVAAGTIPAVGSILTGGAATGSAAATMVVTNGIVGGLGTALALSTISAGIESAASANWNHGIGNGIKDVFCELGNDLLDKDLGAVSGWNGPFAAAFGIFLAPVNNAVTKKLLARGLSRKAANATVGALMSTGFATSNAKSRVQSWSAASSLSKEAAEARKLGRIKEAEALESRAKKLYASVVTGVAMDAAMPLLMARSAKKAELAEKAKQLDKEGYPDATQKVENSLRSDGLGAAEDTVENIATLKGTTDQARSLLKNKPEIPDKIETSEVAASAVQSLKTVAEHRDTMAKELEAKLNARIKDGTVAHGSAPEKAIRELISSLKQQANQYNEQAKSMADKTKDLAKADQAEGTKQGPVAQPAPANAAKAQPGKVDTVKVQSELNKYLTQTGIETPDMYRKAASQLAAEAKPLQTEYNSLIKQLKAAKKKGNKAEEDRLAKKSVEVLRKLEPLKTAEEFARITAKLKPETRKLIAQNQEAMQLMRDAGFQNLLVKRFTELKITLKAEKYARESAAKAEELAERDAIEKMNRAFKDCL